MQTITTPLRYDTPHGTLYLAVTTAMPDNFHEVDGRGDVTELRPRVHVATNPDFEANPNHPDHWTIRRRAYALAATFYLHDLSHVRYSNGYTGGRWHTNSRTGLAGGYVNDRGNKVEYQSATYDLMDKAVTDTLDAFHAEHPQWVELSIYLRLAADHDSAMKEADRLRKEADEAQARGDRLWAEAAPMINALPETLTDLIIR